VESLFAIAVILALGWFWSDSLRARDLALRECKKACGAANAQLLDQTVALAGLSLTRNAEGRVSIRRRYRFEFSLDGGDRYAGQITLAEGRVGSLWLGARAVDIEGRRDDTACP
jgi:hypothetical protein